MKTFLKALSAVVCLTGLLFVVSSCSKDTDPADVDLFVGTYQGNISYTRLSPTESKSSENGKVVVTKIGSTYNFHFSDDIPDLKNIEFKKGDDNTYIGFSNGISGITITQSKLNIFLTTGNETWTANCSR